MFGGKTLPASSSLVFRHSYVLAIAGSLSSDDGNVKEGVFYLGRILQISSVEFSTNQYLLQLMAMGVFLLI